MYSCNFGVRVVRSPFWCRSGYVFSLLMRIRILLLVKMGTKLRILDYRPSMALFWAVCWIRYILVRIRIRISHYPNPGQDPALFVNDFQDANKKYFRGSIFVPVTNGSGSGRPHNFWIRNTGFGPPLLLNVDLKAEPDPSFHFNADPDQLHWDK